MNSRRSKLERNTTAEAEAEAETNAKAQEDQPLDAGTEAKKTSLKEAESDRKPEDRKDDDEAEVNQYEFIMNILRPYKKVIYKLIQLGYIRERTKF